MITLRCNRFNRHFTVKRWVAIFTIGAMSLFVSDRASAGTDDPDSAPSSESAAPTAEAASIVVISIISESVDTQPVEQAINAQLSDLAVHVYFHHLPQLPEDENTLDTLAANQMVAYGAVAAFIILPGDDGALRIVINNDGKIEGANRLVDVSKGVPRHEAFAVIARAAATAVIEQEALRQQAAFADESGKAQSANDTSSASGGDNTDDRNGGERTPGNTGSWKRRVHLDSGLILEFVSDSAALTPGMAVGLSVDFARHWWIRAGAVLFSSVTATHQQTRLTLRRRPFYLESGYQHRMGQFTLGGGASICLDYAVERLSASSSDILLRDEGGELHTSLLVFFRSAWQLFQSTSLYLSLGAAFSLNRTRYEIETPSGNQVMLAIRPVQPVVSVGLQFHFF
jgi:hypothetical protein